jgi:hypothetical protein
MSRRSVLTRFAFWLAAVAIVLRAAVPLLAVGAAQWRGVAVGSVCTVYGVVVPDPAADGHAGHATHHAAHAAHGGHGDTGHGSDNAHGADHCALTALAGLGVSHAPAWPATAPRGRDLAEPVADASGAWADASATWFARRKQGPPDRA